MRTRAVHVAVLSHRAEAIAARAASGGTMPWVPQRLDTERYSFKAKCTCHPACCGVSREVGGYFFIGRGRCACFAMRLRCTNVAVPAKIAIRICHATRALNNQLPGAMSRLTRAYGASGAERRWSGRGGAAAAGVAKGAHHQPNRKADEEADGAPAELGRLVLGRPHLQREELVRRALASRVVAHDHVDHVHVVAPLLQPLQEQRQPPGPGVLCGPRALFIGDRAMHRSRPPPLPPVQSGHVSSIPPY